jgi:hypothetical protein
MRGKGSRGRRVAAVTSTAFLVIASSAIAALVGLPSDGSQVNDDIAAGINPGLSVSGEDPSNADVVGGVLNAGQPAVPWAIFGQQTAGEDQIFSRSFAAGAWTTRGNGTVGGRSSASPTFSGSLNFDQSQDGEAPAIDFAGAGRVVPWATWYENTSGTGFGGDQIFASRFDDTGDANQGKWIFEGQGRGSGGSGVQVPSLNIHTDRNAENPSIAGGSTVAGNAPAPWVTWEEADGSAGTTQIFTSKAVKPSAGPACPPDGVNAAKPGSLTGAVATFCWQQVGIERLASGQATPPNNTEDPSQDVDTTRNGVEPEIAFAGTNDTVPWVVWYENGNTSTTGPDALHNNEMVFAAKAVGPSSSTPPTGTVDGGFNWVAVGNGQQGILDDTAGAGGPCAADSTSEGDCSLNKNANSDAQDPRVAAGTMTAGAPTVPWVTWDENVGGVQQVFVSRLVGTGAAAHFELANNGAPISTGAGSSTRPAITFSGSTPYVTWRENTSGSADKLFVGHFVNASNPTFVLDQSEASLTPDATADVRSPISSSCTDNPFNADGAACQGGLLGAPFFVFTNGTNPRGLFADAYPETPSGGGGTSPGASETPVPGGAGSGTPATSLLSPSPSSVAPVNAKPKLTLTLLTKRLREAVKAGKLKVRVSVSEASSVSLIATVKTLEGRTATKRKQAQQAITIATAKTTFSRTLGGAVSLELNKAGLRLLSKAQHAQLSIVAVATDSTGDQGTAVLAKRLKR